MGIKEEGEIVALDEAKDAADLVVEFLNDKGIDPIVAYCGIRMLIKRMEHQYGIQGMEIVEAPDESELN